MNMAKTGDNHQNRQSEKRKWWRDPSIWTNICIAVFTLFLVGVGYLQWSTLEKTDVTLRRQITVGIQSQRAFTYYSDMTVIQTTNEFGKSVIRIFPKWTNSGDTPTKNLSIYIMCGEDYKAFNYQHGVNARGDIFGPKQTKANGDCEVGLPDVLDKQTKVFKTIFVGAKATYYDVFSTDRHVSEFCFDVPIIQIYSKKDDAVTFNGALVGENCPTHNCTDSECPESERQSD